MVEPSGIANEADDDETRWDERLKKVAQHNPPAGEVGVIHLMVILQLGFGFALPTEVSPVSTNGTDLRL